MSASPFLDFHSGRTKPKELISELQKGLTPVLGQKVNFILNFLEVFIITIPKPRQALQSINCSSFATEWVSVQSLKAQIL